jgi:hypothetical protein
MTSHPANDILDDLFHGCALAAFVEQARLQQTWPDREETRRRAIRLYEDQLARTPRHNRIDVSQPEPLPCSGSSEEPHA